MKKELQDDCETIPAVLKLTLKLNYEKFFATTFEDAVRPVAFENFFHSPVL